MLLNTDTANQGKQSVHFVSASLWLWLTAAEIWKRSFQFLSWSFKHDQTQNDIIKNIIFIIYPDKTPFITGRPF